MNKFNFFPKRNLTQPKESPEYKKSRSTFWRQTSRQILFQYALSLILCPILLMILFFLGSTLYHYYRDLTGDESSVIFWFAQILRETLTVIAVIIGMICWIVLTWHFICKPLRYLDHMMDAAEMLASPSETPIRLPAPLKNLEDNLNLVRTQALRNAALAKEAEQRKNDLIIYLAHDLKTPLTSVIGYLTLLRDEPQISPELRAKYTNISLEKALRLEDLINEFFDITRFNLTTLTLEISKVNLSLMLEQITNEFLPILSEKDLTWETNLEPDLTLSCDPGKLERVFDNLIRNAVNYSYPGTTIRMDLHLIHHTPRFEADNTFSSDFESDSSLDVICICLTNSGKTIPPEKLSHVFEQFFRLDSSRSSETGGAGLGLAISKEIIELHKGTITVASECESISFTIKLPVKNS